MRLELKRAKNNNYIIDDTYNNDLSALEIALDFLVSQKHKKYIRFILSDILQSFESDVKLYAKVNSLLKSRNIDSFIGIGASILKNKDQFSIDASFYASTADFLDQLNLSEYHDEIILIKGRAGADHAWARSKMMGDLPQVVERHIRPPVRYPDGWDDELSEKARRGVCEFNKREYFEQHEWFEEAWMEEQRPIRELYQGILQVGVAFYLIEEDNWAGALKMFRRGLPRLRDLPEVCQAIELATFRARAEAIHAEVAALGAERLDAFDQDLFPQIELAEEWPPS